MSTISYWMGRVKNKKIKREWHEFTNQIFAVLKCQSCNFCCLPCKEGNGLATIWNQWCSFVVCLFHIIFHAASQNWYSWILDDWTQSENTGITIILKAVKISDVNILLYHIYLYPSYFFIYTYHTYSSMKIQNLSS